MKKIQDMILQVSRCLFCGHSKLAVRSYTFRAWHVHCPNCEARGPFGSTPDQAIARWNTIQDQPKNERPEIVQNNSSLQHNQVIWKAIRMQKTFTITDIERLTGIKNDTVYRYARLLDRAGYLREEDRKQAPGAPVVYRCIKPRTIQAPGWTELQAQSLQEEQLRSRIKHLEAIEVEAGL